MQNRVRKSWAIGLLLLGGALGPAVDGLQAGDWPQWRGPNRNGMAEGGAPVKFSATENVLWKAEVPGRGHSTPVISGDRIFLTTAIADGEAKASAAGGGGGFAGGGAAAGIPHRLLVMAYSRTTGKLLWQQEAAKITPHEGYHARYGSFASYASVTDGKHVWSLFGSYGLYCYTVEGKLVWKKELPAMRMRMAFGEGGSPTLHGERLILALDQEGESFIAVYEKTTGKELWRKARQERSSWSTPFVVMQGTRPLVVVSATNRVRAYDLQTGEVEWECGGLGANVIPVPVTADGLLFVMSGFRDPNLLAIRLGRKGDLTGTDAVAWTNQRGNSYTPSPILHEGRLYFLSDNGRLTCLRAATGEPIYLQQRLPSTYNFKASLLAAGGNLYLATEEGDVVVMKMGEKPEVVAVNSMGDEFFIASPVAVDGVLYLRGRNTLYAIGEKKP